MRAYLDAGFLLALLVHSTKGGPAASQLLREVEAPFLLNFLHQLQVENFLVSLQKARHVGRQALGSEGNRLWRHYLAEGVFQLAVVDWDSAFRYAITWNSHSLSPPPVLLLLHPAVAFSEGATDFLSFDPRSREVARAAGLSVLPKMV